MFILNDAVQFVKIKLLDSILLLAWYINKDFFLKKGLQKYYTLCKWHRLVIAPFQRLIFAFYVSDIFVLFLKIQKISGIRLTCHEAE